MRKQLLFIKKVFLITSAIFFINSIAFARENDTGKLLLSGGHNQLFEFSFDREEVVELAKIPDHGGYRANYKNLQKVNDNEFLFETPSNEVGIYNMKTLQEKILFHNSSCPTYFESSGEMLFLKVEKTASGFEEYLYLSSLDRDTPLVLRKLARGSVSKCPIKLNGDEALVFLSYGKNKETSLFNVQDRTFSDSSRLCEPIFGLDDGKLLCLSNETYFISDHEGNKLKGINKSLLNKNNMFPMASFNEVNSLLVQEYRERLFRSTIVNLWILDLNTLEKRLIIEGFGIGKKGAIYLEQ